MYIDYQRAKPKFKFPLAGLMLSHNFSFNQFLIDARQI